MSDISYVYSASIQAKKRKVFGRLVRTKRSGWKRVLFNLVFQEEGIISLEEAKYFSQGDIELYKECFFFNCKRGYLTQEDELARIMRSLNCSPTMEEVAKYMQQHSKSGGKMEFDSFLEAMHDHRETESCKEEILHGFIAQDADRKGYVTANEARHVLSNFGERLSRHEIETLFKEGNVTGGQLRYKEFVDSVMTPAPDY